MVHNNVKSILFFKHFDFILVETKEDLAEAQTIRQEFYKTEQKTFPLDEDSVHILVRRIKDNKFIGTVKLCINKAHNSLNFKKYYDDIDIDHSYVDLSDETDAVYCEITNPITTKEFSNTSIKSDQNSIELAMTTACIVIFEKLNLKSVVYITEKTNIKKLKLEGYNFHKVGSEQGGQTKQCLYVIRGSDLKNINKKKTLSSYMYKHLQKNLKFIHPLIPVCEYNKKSEDY
jgi:hypothetical protein